MNLFHVYFCDMNTDKKTRNYSMARRARMASESTEMIIHAVGELWKSGSLNEITLEAVAERSGVTVRTILRKFGSREGLLEASIQQEAARIGNERGEAPMGDLEGIVDSLLRSYEEMGEAGIRTIYAEPDLEIARVIGERGRQTHREWCIRVFEPYLPAPDAEAYEIRLAAFISVTEIYLWKLLRKDLGFTPDKTKKVFIEMLEGLVMKVRNE